MDTQRIQVLFESDLVDELARVADEIRQAHGTAPSRSALIRKACIKLVARHDAGPAPAKGETVSPFLDIPIPEGHRWPVKTQYPDPATRMCLNIRADGTRCLRPWMGGGYCDRCTGEVSVNLARASHDWDLELNLCLACGLYGESAGANVACVEPEEDMESCDDDGRRRCADE